MLFLLRRKAVRPTCAFSRSQRTQAATSAPRLPQPSINHRAVEPHASGVGRLVDREKL
jgi:hypothetical protein